MYAAFPPDTRGIGIRLKPPDGKRTDVGIPDRRRCAQTLASDAACSARPLVHAAMKRVSPRRSSAPVPGILGSKVETQRIAVPSSVGSGSISPR
jgi:hypothetical protein